jgi:hypothetical protein
MGLLGRIVAKVLGAVPPEERDGIRLDTTHLYWEVSGRTDFPSLFEALSDLLPEDSVLYFEDGAPRGALLEYLEAQEVPERARVAYGTIWPRPRVLHLPATRNTMKRLAEMMKSRRPWELAIHFHVYRGQTVLLQWHDAFTVPMLLSGELPEEKVKAFAERLGMSYKQVAERADASGGGA